MRDNLVQFRYGTPVTTTEPLFPELIPGSFVFDSSTFALYLDTDLTRVQIKDPLKLSLTGGDVSGNINVVDNLGTTLCSLSANNGTVTGVYLQATGNLSMSTAPDLYAVVDSSGKIRTRTKAEMIFDLHILDPDSLGELAYKDTVSGKYTPVGTISAPVVTISYNSEDVVKEVTPGDLPSMEVSGEVLELVPGTQLTSTNTNVMKSISSVEVSAPEFTGSESTITLS